MGSSIGNAYQKTAGALDDLSQTSLEQVGQGYLTGGFLPLGKRIRNDQKAQAEGQADAEQAAAAAANRRADDAAPKALDPMVEERRRRAQIARNNGRESTILTNPNTLGTSDIARKVLLGL